MPGWSRSVRVVGTADAVWRKPLSGGWCVVEYKLGLTSPEADLCQACLYYEMLSEYNSGRGEGALAIVRFQPQRNETFYPSRDLETRREWLVQLIGWVAGVSAQNPGSLRRPTEHDELLDSILRTQGAAIIEAGVKAMDVKGVVEAMRDYDKYIHDVIMPRFGDTLPK